MRFEQHAGNVLNTSGYYPGMYNFPFLSTYADVKAFFEQGVPVPTVYGAVFLGTAKQRRCYILKGNLNHSYAIVVNGSTLMEYLPGDKLVMRDQNTPVSSGVADWLLRYNRNMCICLNHPLGRMVNGYILDKAATFSLTTGALVGSDQPRFERVRTIVEPYVTLSDQASARDTSGLNMWLNYRKAYAAMNPPADEGPSIAATQWKPKGRILYPALLPRDDVFMPESAIDMLADYDAVHLIRAGVENPSYRATWKYLALTRQDIRQLIRPNIVVHRRDVTEELRNAWRKRDHGLLWRTLRRVVDNSRKWG